MPQFVRLTNTDNRVVVDDEDYATVAKYDWYLFGGRARSSKKIGGKYLFMHHLIMMPANGLVIVHLDGDLLDCRKENLRAVTRSQAYVYSRNNNNINKMSKYMGVSFDASRGKWKAIIRRNKKTVYVGSYSTEEEAALARDEAAKKEYGEFAKLNFK